MANLKIIAINENLKMVEDFKQIINLTSKDDRNMKIFKVSEFNTLEQSKDVLLDAYVYHLLNKDDRVVIIFECISNIINEIRGYRNGGMPLNYTKEKIEDISKRTCNYINYLKSMGDDDMEIICFEKLKNRTEKIYSRLETKCSLLYSADSIYSVDFNNKNILVADKVK